MSLFNFFGGKERSTKVDGELIDNIITADLTFRDSPIQVRKPEESTRLAVVGAIENLLGGKTYCDIPIGNSFNFTKYLVHAEKHGATITSSSSIKIKGFHPIPNFNAFVDSLENGEPCLLQMKITKDIHFVNVNNTMFPEYYSWAVTGYKSEIDSLVLKDIKGESFGTNGYVYLNRDNLFKAVWTGYVITGLNFKN